MKIYKGEESCGDYVRDQKKCAITVLCCVLLLDDVFRSNIAMLSDAIVLTRKLSCFHNITCSEQQFGQDVRKLIYHVKNSANSMESR